MNERIRELAHEAGLPTYNPEGVPTKLEKFAELIVAKMLQTCEDHPTWTGRMIGEKIKEHFGVKE